MDQTAHAIVAAWRAYLGDLHPATEYMAHDCNDYLEDIHWAELERLIALGLRHGVVADGV